MHDYDPAWDYDIDKRPNKRIAQLTKTVSRCIKKSLMPSIKEFSDFRIHFIKNNDSLGIYVSGTRSEPVILINAKELKSACDTYDADYVTGVETTIVHELGHAIQDARGTCGNAKVDEKEAEEFAYQYSVGNNWYKNIRKGNHSDYWNPWLNKKGRKQNA